MANWQKIEELSDLWDQVAAALEPISDAAEMIENTLDAIAAVADVIGNILALLENDPLSLFILAILEAINGLLSDLEEMDIYMFPLLVTSWEGLLRPYTVDEAMTDFLGGFDDNMDSIKPEFGPNAAVASFSVIVGTDTWADFAKLLALLKDFFGQIFGGWGRLADIRIKVEEYTLPRKDKRNTQGVPWDWYKTGWQEMFPVIGEAIEKIRSVLEALAGALVGATNALEDIIDLLKEKLAYIQDLLNAIYPIIEMIKNLAKLLPNAYWLFTTDDRGGTSKYVDSVINAGNRPNFKLTAGATFMTGAPNGAAAFQQLAALFGMQVQQAEAAVAVP